MFSINNAYATKEDAIKASYTGPFWLYGSVIPSYGFTYKIALEESDGEMFVIAEVHDFADAINIYTALSAYDSFKRAMRAAKLKIPQVRGNSDDFN